MAARGGGEPACSPAAAKRRPPSPETTPGVFASRYEEKAPVTRDHSCNREGACARRWAAAGTQ